MLAALAIFKYFWFSRQCMILILGRFQPLHNGHMKVIRDAYKEDHDIAIAVGSAGRSNEKNNPFSGEERKNMLTKAFQADNIPIKVVLVPNLPSDEDYVKHVLEHVKDRPSKIITENPWTIDLFTKAGYEVTVTDRHFELSATDIRNKIAEDKNWEDLVPTKVAEIIKEIDGINRIKDLCKDTS